MTSVHKSADFYDTSLSKFATVNILKTLKLSVEDSNGSTLNEILQSAICAADQGLVLHPYHIDLMRILSKLEYESGEPQHLFLQAIQKNLDFRATARWNSYSSYTQRGYLKLICSVLKNSSFDGCIIKDPFLKTWTIDAFSNCSWGFLDKYYFKIFRQIIKDDKDIDFKVELLQTIMSRKYCSIILKDSHHSDAFVNIHHTGNTMHCQAHALDICLVITRDFVLSGNVHHIAAQFDVQTAGRNMQTIKHYIRSVLADNDDLFLRNLISLTELGKVLRTHSVETNLDPEVNLIMSDLCDVFYWFDFFVEHINYDHSVIVDWFLESNELCEKYLKLTLPFLSEYFVEFSEYFNIKSPNIQSDQFDKVMSFLIRCNLKLESTNSVLCDLIDAIERKYEMADMSAEDPLGGILAKQFNSYCSFSEVEEVHTPIAMKNKPLGLVSYSDSD